jgi:hypothetical protein
MRLTQYMYSVVPLAPCLSEVIHPEVFLSIVGPPSTSDMAVRLSVETSHVAGTFLMLRRLRYTVGRWIDLRMLTLNAAFTFCEVLLDNVTAPSNECVTYLR